MLTHKQLRTKALGDAEVKAEFEKLSDEFALWDEFLKARTDQGLTQAQVAQKIGTTQSAVARMESGSGKHSPSLATLSKYADALGCKLELRLVRKTPSAKKASAPSSSHAPRAAEL
jgi:transcriptional regulator with XRE-family HTH domain